MSCSAVSCKNRPSPGTGISFHRFPLDDKDRLQKWLVNLRRDNFTPSPSARICSQHFEDSCFFMNIHGKLCLSKTAVPTLFYYPISFRSWRKYWSKRDEEKVGDDSRGPLNVVGTTTDHHPPGPITTNHGAPHDLFKTETRSRFVEVDVILNESIKEEDDDIALDMPNVSPVVLKEAIKEEDDDVALDTPEANVSSVIFPTEVCVITVEHDHCYCLSYFNTDGKHEEILKNKLQTVLGKITAFRKQMKIKNQMIRRLKSRVLLLKAKVKSERSEKDKMHVILSKLQKDLDCQLQPKLTSPDL